jgi:MFS family permease
VTVGGTLPAGQSLAPAAAQPVRRPPAGLWYFLEAINSLGATYFFNYLFFYMRDHYGFGNKRNLLITVLYGAVYTTSAWNAGRFAQRFGYLRSLRLGFAGTGLAMVLAGIAPHVLGYSRATMWTDCLAEVLWTASVCLIWPTIQALLTLNKPASAMPRAAGFYNITWAATAALAYFTGGALLQTIGGEILFWIPAGLHLVGLLILVPLRKVNFTAHAPLPEAGNANPSQPAAPTAKARNFLLLAWVANPFAYMAINGILPVIPKLAERLSLDAAWAGLVCSLWFWMRFVAFVWFWFWPGWHYRFRWLLAAFVALAVSFTSILLSTEIWMLLAAQVAFGLAIGLIYSSSLFYSMDAGESRGRRGGFHEAAIGIGTFAGPAVGATALQLQPAHANAGTWAISALLLLGVVPFIVIRWRGLREER